MPKQYFWPTTLVIMGLVIIASRLGYLPAQFDGLWLIILVIVGLGGLLTADRSEWTGGQSRAATKPTHKTVAKKKRK